VLPKTVLPKTVLPKTVLPQCPAVRSTEQQTSTQQ
jgi:hypothetical protein